MRRMRRARDADAIADSHAAHLGPHGFDDADAAVTLDHGHVVHAPRARRWGEPARHGGGCAGCRRNAKTGRTSSSRDSWLRCEPPPGGRRSAAASPRATSFGPGLCRARSTPQPACGDHRWTLRGKCACRKVRKRQPRRMPQQLRESTACGETIGALSADDPGSSSVNLEQLLNSLSWSNIRKNLRASVPRCGSPLIFLGASAWTSFRRPSDHVA